ncbi:unnamed protein product [Trichobilharzia regenti]|nr:unnamed protein product [Trichobilharzia regenti]
MEEQNLIQRRISIAGFQEEDDLVSESANRERGLRNQVHDLEVELKDVKLKYERQMAENDALHRKILDQQSSIEDMEKQSRNLKGEIKDAKAKEVEFESVRHELKRLQEENDVIHVQLEEITRLKRMTEKSLEDALESLQIERDQRHNLRKELDSRIISDSISHLSDLRNLSSLGHAELAHMEAEKNELTRTLETTQRSLELATSEVSNKQERINGLLAQLDAIMSVKSEADSEFETKEMELEVQTTANSRNAMGESCISISSHVDENEDPNGTSQTDLKRLRKALRLNENRYSVALRQIASMQHDLWRYHEREKLESRPELASEEGLKQELVRLQGILEQRSDEVKTLQTKLSASEAVSCTNYNKVVYVADRFSIPLRVDRDSSDNSVGSDLVTTDEPTDEQLTQECPTTKTSEITPGSDFEGLSEEADLHLTVVTQLRHLVNTFNEKYSQMSNQLDKFIMTW